MLTDRWRCRIQKGSGKSAVSCKPNSHVSWTRVRRGLPRAWETNEIKAILSGRCTALSTLDRSAQDLAKPDAPSDFANVGSPPISTPGTLLTKLPLACAPTGPTTPPSGVSIRIGSGRNGLNYGVIRSRQVTEKKIAFESVSILVKGGWKETRGVRRPISGQRPVSESRMASLNPFEPKRKKAHAGASSRVREWYVAEGMTQVPNSLHPLSY